MLKITVLVLIFLFFLSYIIFDKDIMAPPTIVALSFVFGSICTLYNEKKWGLDFSSTTTWTIFIGIFAFLIGGVAVRLLHFIRTRSVCFHWQPIEVRSISVKYLKTCLVILLQLVTLGYLFHEIKRITGESSWTKMVLVYRDLTDWDQNLADDTLILPWLLRQLLEMNFVFGLMYVFIIGNNIVAKDKNHLIINCVPIVLCSLITFLLGYRSDMLRLWIALLIVIYVSYKRKFGWRRNKETKKMIYIMAISVLIIAVLFVALRATVGRAETDWDPLDYLTHYAGSPIAAFDLFLKSPLEASPIWGKECFFNLNSLIAKWFNRPELKYIFYKEFRISPNGNYWIGNVYTALRPPYYDFGGIKGMTVFMMLFGFLFTWLYYKVHKSYGKSKIDFMLLLYSYLAYTFFLYFYNMYNNFFSPGFLKFIFELLVVRWFLVDCDSSQKTRILIRKD